MQNDDVIVTLEQKIQQIQEVIEHETSQANRTFSFNNPKSKE
jgi:hypothetical protein